MSCGCATGSNRKRETEHRIITAWSIIRDAPVYNIQYFKKGLFGKEWRTTSHEFRGITFSSEFSSIEEAQDYIKKEKEEDNFVSKIISYDNNGGALPSSHLEEVKKGYRPCHGAAIFWLLVLIGLIIFGLFYFR